MEFKDLLKRKKTRKEIVIDGEKTTDIRRYVDEPGMVASIVEESIDSGNYSFYCSYCEVIGNEEEVQHYDGRLRRKEYRENN